MNSKGSDSTKILNRNAKPCAFFVRRGKLVVVSGDDQGKTLLIDRPKVTFGTAKDNSLILSDSTVSRHHAVLMESAGGYLIKDLNSTNGTYLNGVLIREAYLEFGEVITLGQTKITFVPFEEKIEVYPSSKNVYCEVYGQSLEMRTIFSILQRVAATDVTIVLEGETCTGKELIARAIHANSTREKNPLWSLTVAQ